MSQDVLPEQWLFHDHVGNDVGAMFAILVGAMIAAGGGLGGGGVFVPIYILILGYPPKFAAALSQATIFGGSIVNLIMNLKKSHPTRKHRPLTDFSTLLIFEPMLLVGTIIGVFLNVIFPDILILILLALVLSYATLRTSRKGIRLWKKETSDMQEEKEKDKKQGQKEKEVQIEMQTTQTDAKPTHDKPSKKSGETDANTASTNDGEMSVNTQEIIDELADGCGCDPSLITPDKVEICKAFIHKEAQVNKPFGIILLVWLFVSMFAILRKEEFTGVALCDIMYWIVTFVPIPIMMGVSYFMTRKEYDYYQAKLNSHVWVPAWGDIELDGAFVKILKYPAIASIAGILGGLLGIGGGMIVSPLLIELGVIPTVAAATSAMAVMITSSSAMLQFLLLGFLQWDYTLFFMIVGVCGTYVGQTVVNHAVKKYGRVSVVIFAVATVMGLAIILMLINGLISLVDGVSWGFVAPC
eukprot:472951_1